MIDPGHPDYTVARHLADLIATLPIDDLAALRASKQAEAAQLRGELASRLTAGLGYQNDDVSDRDGRRLGDLAIELRYLDSAIAGSPIV